jgi:hypothetical protein
MLIEHWTRNSGSSGLNPFIYPFWLQFGVLATPGNVGESPARGIRTQVDSRIKRSGKLASITAGQSHVAQL